MPADLPTSSPSAQGVAASGVQAFLDDMADARGVELHSLMVLRHGHVVASGWWAPYTPERLHLLYSLSKTFTAAAAGLAVADGLLDLGETVVSCLPELAAQVGDARTRAMRVVHLASMSTGHTEDMWEPAVAADPHDPVAGFLGLPPQQDPGSVFTYNQCATATLATIVRRRTGGSLLDLLRPRLLDPLGVGEVAWLGLPDGGELGFSGLHATTDAVARLGQLLLQQGRWQEAELLDPGWVDEMSRPHAVTSQQDGVDWQQGYGLQVWRSRHGYRGDGAYGQYCLVLPEQDAVVAVTGQSVDMQRVLDGVWAHLLPALDAGGEGEAPDAALASRLATLSLPPAPGLATPEDPDRWDGARFHPDETVAQQQPSLLGARVERGPGGWLLVLDDDGRELRLPVPGPGWTTSTDGLPVAVGGGWRSDRLELALVLLETPHRLTVVLDLPAGGGGPSTGGRLTARWTSTPLHQGPLHGMRAPEPPG